MATRTVTVETEYKTLDEITPVDILVAMFDEGDAPTENAPVTLTAVALAMNLTDADTFKTLDMIANMTEIIDGDRQGNWWFTNEYDSADEMVEAYKKLEDLTTKKTKRAIKAAAAKPVQRAVEPVKAADGTTVTVPVSEGSTERRELDAAQGERVLSEDDMRDVVKSLMVSLPAALEITEHESDIEKNGLVLDEPEFIPAMTDAAIDAGVSENAWYMMYAAITETARNWWTKFVNAKIEANDTNEVPASE